MERNGHVHGDAGLVDLDLRFLSSWAVRGRGAATTGNASVSAPVITP